ncbi:hypothetical protein COOONC_27226 [Cooperia oncophora]
MQPNLISQRDLLGCIQCWSGVGKCIIASDSPSRYEFAVAREFFQELGSPFHVVVALKAADEGNLLRPKYIDKAIEIEDFLQYKLKVEHEGKKYSYSDFCGTQCETSDAVSIFLTMFRDQQTKGKKHVKLTYPSMDVFGHRVYLANNIFMSLEEPKTGRNSVTKLYNKNGHLPKIPATSSKECSM